MSRGLTLADVRALLTPSLERINPHLAAPVAKARGRGELVEAHAQRNGPRVDLMAKGLRLDLTPNARLHPQQVARRRRREHQVVTAALRGVTPPAGPWRVVITRVGPRAMDDDNRTASAASSSRLTPSATGAASTSSRRGCGWTSPRTRGCTPRWWPVGAGASTRW